MRVARFRFGYFLQEDTNHLKPNNITWGDLSRYGNYKLLVFFSFIWSILYWFLRITCWFICRCYKSQVWFFFVFRLLMGITANSFLTLLGLGIALEHQIAETDWLWARYDQLNLLDEKRLRATNHMHVYQRKMVYAFKKRVKPKKFQKCDLVLRVLRRLISDPRGKFKPS